MGTSVSVNLRKNWYVSDNFLGFAVCYSGKYHINRITAHLIPCDDGMSSMTQEFALPNNCQWDINFLLVPLSCLWDASNANEKTPNDYGCIKLDFIRETDDDFIRETVDFIEEIDDDFEEADDDFEEKMKSGVHLLYKNESELNLHWEKEE
uniref:Putative ovule protein n=2 Tax=Solanum chacoense TaxID=4108 RepID=A0A0V0HQ04_SOLCH